MPGGVQQFQPFTAGLAHRGASLIESVHELRSRSLLDQPFYGWAGRRNFDIQPASGGLPAEAPKAKAVRGKHAEAC